MSPPLIESERLTRKIDRLRGLLRSLMSWDHEGIFTNRPKLEEHYYHLLEDSFEEINYLVEKRKLALRKEAKEYENTPPIS